MTMMKKMMTENKIKTYSELIKYSTFEDRINYLRLFGFVGEDTFGFDRFINQKFYKSLEWKNLRNYIIARDFGCDLGIQGREILDSRILIHHMNPITKDDIINSTEYLLNPEYLITVSKSTHDFIHYGNEDFKEYCVIERKRNDTCPWKY